MGERSLVSIGSSTCFDAEILRNATYSPTNKSSGRHFLQGIDALTCSVAYKVIGTTIQRTVRCLSCASTNQSENAIQDL